jgi:ATP-dependent RNA helicase DDX24/MAK5
VVEHLQRLLKHITPDSDSNEAIGGKKRPPRVSIGSVVGGLSAQKQKRIVERGCDVLVATPGRLWDLIKSVSEFMISQLSNPSPPSVWILGFRLGIGSRR